MRLILRNKTQLKVLQNNAKSVMAVIQYITVQKIIFK